MVQTQVNCKEHKIQCTNDNTNYKVHINVWFPPNQSLPIRSQVQPVLRLALSADGMAPSSAKASAITRQYQLNYENDKNTRVNNTRIPVYPDKQLFYSNLLQIDYEKYENIA